jgi:hypothetical protein
MHYVGSREHVVVFCCCCFCCVRILNIFTVLVLSLNYGCFHQQRVYLHYQNIYTKMTLAVFLAHNYCKDTSISLSSANHIVNFYKENNLKSRVII